MLILVILKVFFLFNFIFFQFFIVFSWQLKNIFLFYSLFKFYLSLMQRIFRSTIVSTNWHTFLFNYLTKATPQDNTLGIVFYNIFLWCIVSLSSILVFFLTSVKEGYILEIQMLIKYSLLHFIYLCKQIAINSTLVLATTYETNVIFFNVIL